MTASPRRPRSGEKMTEMAPSATQTLLAALRGSKRPKFGNRKVSLDGYTFDSAAEGKRYVVLRERQRDGEIANLEVHPRFEFVVNMVMIGKYTPDFAYSDGAGYVVEDVKSKPTRTEAYGLRKKLMLAIHGIRVQEILSR